MKIYIYLLLDTKLVIYDSRTPDCRTADHKSADYILYLLLDTKLVIYDSRTPDSRTANHKTADYKTADNKTTVNWNILYCLSDTKLVIYDSRTPDCRTAETITAEHKTADSRTVSPASSSTVKSSQQQPGMNCNPSTTTLIGS